MCLCMSENMSSNDAFHPIPAHRRPPSFLPSGICNSILSALLLSVYLLGWSVPLCATNLPFLPLLPTQWMLFSLTPGSEILACTLDHVEASWPASYIGHPALWVLWALIRLWACASAQPPPRGCPPWSAHLTASGPRCSGRKVYSGLVASGQNSCPLRTYECDRICK